MNLPLPPSVPPSMQGFRLRMAVAGLTVALVALAGVLAVGLRGESTRTQVQRVDSPCARAASRTATVEDISDCQRIRREADRIRPVQDSCIILRRTLKADWYSRITVCPSPIRPGRRTDGR